MRQVLGPTYGGTKGNHPTMVARVKDIALAAGSRTRAALPLSEQVLVKGVFILSEIGANELILSLKAEHYV